MFLPRAGFYMAKPAVPLHITQGCLAKTSATVSMFNKARTDYYGLRAVRGESTNIFLLTESMNIWKSSFEKIVPNVY